MPAYTQFIGVFQATSEIVNSEHTMVHDDIHSEMRMNTQRTHVWQLAM